MRSSKLTELPYEMTDDALRKIFVKIPEGRKLWSEVGCMDTWFPIDLNPAYLIGRYEIIISFKNQVSKQ